MLFNFVVVVVVHLLFLLASSDLFLFVLNCPHQPGSETSARKWVDHNEHSGARHFHYVGGGSMSRCSCCSRRDHKTDQEETGKLPDNHGIRMTPSFQQAPMNPTYGSTDTWLQPIYFNKGTNFIQKHGNIKPCQAPVNSWSLYEETKGREKHLALKHTRTMSRQRQ